MIWHHNATYTVIILICILFQSSLAENCSTLDGTWFNQLGSSMDLTHTKDGMIIGVYRTAVERQQEAAGVSHSRVIGAAPYETAGSAFGMAVLWSNGSSATSWTGQCQICEDGKEMLITSWLLRERVDTCIDKWKSTRIGRDTFTREPPQTSSGGTFTYNEQSSYSQREKRDTGNESVRRCFLDGFWYNQLGSEVILQYHEDNTITGEYRTGVERERGAAGHTHSKVYGIGNPMDTNTTFALFVVWKNGESVTGWVGQCHMCGGEVLEATWLLRTKVPTCHDAWRSTLYGESTFTRQEQQSGPRRKEGTHTPTEIGEVGEDDGTLERALLCPGQGQRLTHSLLITLLMALASLLPH